MGKYVFEVASLDEIIFRPNRVEITGNITDYWHTDDCPEPKVYKDKNLYVVEGVITEATYNGKTVVVWTY